MIDKPFAPIHTVMYWESMFYRLLLKYDALMHLYEQEVGPIEDIVAFEKRMMEEFNEKE